MKFLQKLLKFGNLFNDVEIYALLSLSFKVTKGFIQGDFFNWYPPKIHKYGKKLKYQNWYPPKNSKCQPVSKF